MAFQGALQELPLPDIIQLVAVSGKTGVFSIQNGQTSGMIYLRKGQIVHAEVGDLKGEEALYELAIWPEGEFVFTPNQETDLTTIQKTNTNLLMEAARRIDEWKVLSQRIPSTRMVPVFSDDGGRSSVSLSREEWAVVRKIDEKRSIEEIANALGTSSFEVSKVLYGLITNGLVELSENLGHLEAERLHQMTVPELERLSAEIHDRAQSLLGNRKEARELDESYTSCTTDIGAGRGVDAVLDLIRAEERIVFSALGPNQAKSFLESVTQLVAQH